ncbi:MAG: lipid-A-disaccharide synthase, partial [Deltaproteobacteria bacterium]
TKFIIPIAPSIDSNLIQKMLPASLVNQITLLRQPLVKALENVAFALVTSGTATLETALAEVPMVVVYKVNELSYQLGRRLISVPHISLVNLIAEKEIVPELIQHDTLPENITRHMRSQLDNPEIYLKVCHELKELKKKLGRSGAPARVAKAIIGILKENE